MISCLLQSLLSYPIVPNTLIIHNFLSYQASLVYNPKEFLGVITHRIPFNANNCLDITLAHFTMLGEIDRVP